jgi:hypothetical protein
VSRLLLLLLLLRIRLLVLRWLLLMWTRWVLRQVWMPDLSLLYLLMIALRSAVGVGRRPSWQRGRRFEPECVDITAGGQWRETR